jgi:hypothetical protein
MSLMLEDLERGWHHSCRHPSARTGAHWQSADCICDDAAARAVGPSMLSAISHKVRIWNIARRRPARGSCVCGHTRQGIRRPQGPSAGIQTINQKKEAIQIMRPKPDPDTTDMHPKA